MSNYSPKLTRLHIHLVHHKPETTIFCSYLIKCYAIVKSSFWTNYEKAKSTGKTHYLLYVSIYGGLFWWEMPFQRNDLFKTLS